MGVVKINQFDIVLVSLDPTQGFEINKTRPCVVISPNEMNQYLKTLIVAPLTTKGKNYPTRISITLNGKESNIVLDQIRTIDKSRVLRKLGSLYTKAILLVLKSLEKMFIGDNFHN